MRPKRTQELESPQGLDQLTPPARLNKMSGSYVPAPWPSDIARPESNNHERYPSRMGDTLHYRNGTKARV